MRGLRVSKQPGDLSSLCTTELSTGPFCVIRSNPTHQLTDPIQLNPLQVGKFGPNATQPNTTNLTAWCSQILSDRALNALKFQNFSTFAGVDPTEPTKNWKILTQPDPIQPNPWVNPTHGQLWCTRKTRCVLEGADVVDATPRHRSEVNVLALSATRPDHQIHQTQRIAESYPLCWYK